MKNLLNLGKALNKAEQKEIFGGTNRLTMYSDPCNGEPNCGGGGGGGNIPGDDSCTSDAECDGVEANDEWLEGYCQITGNGSGICVLG